MGIETRNEMGFLLWDHTDEATAAYNLGSRLKTPVLPIWITHCNGRVGILFNPNRELMRSYHAENRFQLYYYSDCEAKKDEGARKETMLTVDTRGIAHNGGPGGVDDDDADGDLDEAPTPPMELLIKTK